MVRFRSRVPRCCSRSATRRDSDDVEIPSRSAAATTTSARISIVRFVLRLDWSRLQAAIRSADIDIVILDDNFSSLTQAVLYGRTLFKSIRKFLVFQLTVNVSAVPVVFLGPFFGFDLPLTMIQLLWLNLIMDTLAGLAFAGEAALPRYLREKPLRRDEPLITADMRSSILLNGGIIALLSLLFLTSDTIHALFSGGQAVGTPSARAKLLTAFFAFFVFIQFFNTFNARTQGLNLFEHLLENRLFIIIIPATIGIQVLFVAYGGDVLRTVGLTAREWVSVLLMAFVVIPADLLRKGVRNRWFGNPVI